MPIYEFRCLKCNNFFELLIMNSDEKMKPECPECHSENFERVLSAASHVMGGAKGGQSQGAQTRTCSSGSCATYTIPGPD